jgi:hypothetical protein
MPENVEQLIKRRLAAAQKTIDGFVKESGFRHEQVLNGKSREQWLKEHEARLRQKHAQNPQQARPVR